MGRTMSEAPETLADYNKGLLLEIDIDAETDGAETSPSEAFTDWMLELLCDAGDVESALSCHYKSHGVEVHGYAVSEGGSTVDLFTTVLEDSSSPQQLSKRDVVAVYKRAFEFWNLCRQQNLLGRLEESSDAFDMVNELSQAAQSAQNLRITLLTNAIVDRKAIPTPSVDSVPVTHAAWDLVRIFRADGSGDRREPIVVDFIETYGQALPCVSVPKTADYQVYLAVVPGTWLAETYTRFGARLLERNVRSYLQATGKVNRGLQSTLRDAPQMFLAYNNGITVTAAAAETSEHGITRISDFQIVNGGQTTGSLARALNSGVNLDDVFVQAKITVVQPDDLDTMVHDIARYANSQNRVSEPDLTSNNPFHVALEEISRTTWAPAQESTHRQTRWFYERARGQYADELSKETTPARKRQWKDIHPTAQRIRKEDLAKYESAWDQRPHDVALGAQKNYTRFMAKLKEHPKSPDQDYFRRTIAKAILWKTTERIVSQQRWGGYRAQVVALTIAKISHASSQRLDLEAIWATQSVEPILEDALLEIATLAWRVLTEEGPRGGNVTEWAKKENSWLAMKGASWKAPLALETTYVAIRGTGTEQRSVEAPLPTPSTQAEEPHTRELTAVDDVSAETWFALAAWAKATGNLQPFQRSQAFNCGKAVSNGRNLSPKMLPHAEKIFEEASRLGFANE